MTQSRQMLTTPYVTIDGKQVTPKRSHYQTQFEAADLENKAMMLESQTSANGNGQAIVVASNDNRDIKTFTGDIVNKGLGVNHSDTTASAYREFVLA